MSPFFAISIPGFDYLVEGFAYALKFCYDVTGSFGLAIILITVAMRVVLLPLTIKQTKSMIAMQRLQPQLKEIQKKYKDDREKQGQEMMKLYKENKVSPLGGCLPLILQLPIIFAIFQVLHNLSNVKSEAVKIIGSGTNFVFLGMDMRLTGSKLWNNGAYVQVILLVLLTVVTGYISAKMMTTDPKQAKMMAMMPVLMGVFAIILPAGVTIYIIVTNILTFAQQYVQLEREGFYDEKRAELTKSGDMEKLHNSLKFRFIDYGSKALTSLRIKPVTPKKKVTKPAGNKPAGTAKAGKAPAKKKGKPNQPAKKRSAGKKAPTTGNKAPSGKKAEPKKASSGKGASKKTTLKGYPAKKKGKGK